MSYLTSAKENVHLFVETCVKAGLKHVVISPGSRNAPLTISFDEHPEVSCYMVHDERSAAFFAMGIALEIQEPVAVICTSGSAVANYFPAVTEAFYQCIPLVVISADRPEEWINHGDGQTIMQKEIFGNHVHQFLQLVDKDSSEDYETFLRDETFSIISLSKSQWSGPVHINFALEEPLYGTKEVQEIGHLLLQDFTFDLAEAAEDIDWENFQSKWSKAEKKLILCGQLPKDEALLHQLKEIASDPSVLVMVENTANLVSPSFVHCIDRTIEHLDKENTDFQPDILVTIGGAIVSKKVKNLFRSWPISEHWKIGFEFPEMDTFRKLTASVLCEPSQFIRKMNEADRQSSISYAPKWKQIDFLRKDFTQEFCESAPYSDLSVFYLTLDCLPEHSTLHLANSSVVRYAQLFDPIQNVKYNSNRGTSGIDGSTSTAVGAASMKPDDWHVLITGDISFFYDSNALWNQHLTPNLRIVLINNAGGGIFKIIPGPNSTKQYEPYFVAQHHHSAEHICKAFDVEYMKATSKETLLNQMEDFYTYSEDGRPKLIEVFTESDLNPKVLAEYFEGLRTKTSDFRP
jgi:2-succinyl-5-enolpyruvyl-6-hydroxy-3-cyclohexene-1-carboxylate synthase